MSFMKTNAVNITVGSTTYNSLADFGFAIGNNDYIGEPVQPNNIILVPGSSKPLDLTETVFGKQYFTHREIKIRFGAVRAPEQWDSEMSRFRNLFSGKIVKLSFANDPDWYWTGRAQLSNFSRQRAIGQFDFKIPYADPYKYKTILTEYDVIPASIGRSQVCANDQMSVIPEFHATDPCTLAFGSITKTLAAGKNTFRDIVFEEGDNEIVLTGTVGTVTISYREGRL